MGFENKHLRKKSSSGKQMSKGKHLEGVRWGGAGKEKK